MKLTPKTRRRRIRTVDFTEMPFERFREMVRHVIAKRHPGGYWSRDGYGHKRNGRWVRLAVRGRSHS